MIRAESLIPIAVILLVCGSAGPAAEPAKAKREKVLDLYRAEARGYSIYRDSSRREEAVLLSEPIYVWTNPTANGGQDGAVFLWTYRGRPEAVATIFVQPPTGRREMIHELHSLSLSVLDVSRPGAHTWTPEAPGITLTAVAGAPDPAGTGPARLVQMRSLMRQFSGRTVDRDGKRWDLRLLSQPLYRYASTDPDVIDGALFAFVSSAGTDPDAFVLLEARRPAPGADPVWQSGYARFTDHRLLLFHQAVEVYSAPQIEFNTGREDAKHRYRLFVDRVIEPADVP